jgi:hypothetical protein
MKIQEALLNAIERTSANIAKYDPKSRKSKTRGVGISSLSGTRHIERYHRKILRNCGYRLFQIPLSQKRGFSKKSLSQILKDARIDYLICLHSVRPKTFVKNAGKCPLVGIHRWV